MINGINGINGLTGYRSLARLPVEGVIVGDVPEIPRKNQPTIKGRNHGEGLETVL